MHRRADLDGMPEIIELGVASHLGNGLQEPDWPHERKSLRVRRTPLTERLPGSRLRRLLADARTDPARQRRLTSRRDALSLRRLRHAARSNPVAHFSGEDHHCPIEVALAPLRARGTRGSL